MKTLLKYITVILLLLSITSCSNQYREEKFKQNHLISVSESIGIDITECSIGQYIEEHGSFGDGVTFVKALITDEESIETICNFWNPLPLSDSLSEFAYGTKERTSFSWEGKQLFCPVENGYYYFYDNHNESTDPYDDTDVLNRYSVNFEMAIFDLDTNILYYCKYDT
ncbi:MAG: hypothetical protein IJB24_07555 [Clostridia bacterium]|nr:hypothetical protein [Clostridia bacterium]